MNRIALGTVQFGMNYGVANQIGQITLEAGKAIINEAKKAGIDTLDTAILYGKSEEILGKIDVSAFRVITKLPEIPQSSDIKATILRLINDSLGRLKINRLTGILLHRPLQLLEPGFDIIFRTLEELKKNGLVEKIGFSIYSPEDLDILWDDFKPDIVQAPFNIFDQRLLQSGWLQKMKIASVETHIRSVFLQGLLLMNQDKRPVKFQKWSQIWSKWHNWLKVQNISAIQAAIDFVLFQKEIDKIIIGVDSLQHLKEILRVANQSKYVDFKNVKFTNDELLINPARWASL
jgi:aryl-alcohol dehydrogenase-like predicted oxidoreductase